jgi:DNA-binding MarR family transcriptional regulator
MMKNPSPVERLRDLFVQLREMSLLQDAIAHSGLSLPQFGILDCIARSPGCGVQDIANFMGVTSPTISVGIRKLVKLGLVERKRNLSDRRERPLYMTDLGEKKYIAVKEAHFDALEKFLSGLTLEEQEHFIHLLEKAIAAVDNRETYGTE